MPQKETVRVTDTHPAVQNERRSRKRVQFWASVAVGVALAVVAASALVWASKQAGRTPSLLAPGVIVPLALLGAIIVLALAVKSWAGSKTLQTRNGKLLGRPGPVTRWLLREKVTETRLESVDRINLVYRPQGAALALFSTDGISAVPLGLSRTDWIEELL